MFKKAQVLVPIATLNSYFLTLSNSQYMMAYVTFYSKATRGEILKPYNTVLNNTQETHTTKHQLVISLMWWQTQKHSLNLKKERA